jgi:hypothetical protein
MVGHEVGHHLRQRYGRFGPPLAEEDRIASQLAIAFVRRYLAPHQQEEILRALAKGIANLSCGLPSTQGTEEINQRHDLIYHVYKHMNRFYEGLLTLEEHQIAAFVQIYLKPSWWTQESGQS